MAASALSAAAVRRRLVAAVRRANPGRIGHRGGSAPLARLPPPSRYRHVSHGLLVSAPGYRPTRMLGTVDSDGTVSVR